MDYLKAEQHRQICLIRQAGEETGYTTRIEMTNFVTYLPNMTEFSDV